MFGRMGKDSHRLRDGLSRVVHLLCNVDDGIHTGKGVHRIAHAHDPGNAIRPPTNSVKLDQEAGVVVFLAHGKDRNGNNNESGNRQKEACFGPLAKMALRDCEDGNYYGELAAVVSSHGYLTNIAVSPVWEANSQVRRISATYSKNECHC